MNAIYLFNSWRGEASASAPTASEQRVIWLTVNRSGLTAVISSLQLKWIAVI